MQTLFTNSHQNLSNILGLLSNISYDYFNHSITSYCGLFIIVLLTLLGFVLFAEEIYTTIPVSSLLDTKADFTNRQNDNRIALDLSFQQNLPGLGASAFLIDRNDSSGVRMSTLLANRTASFRVINGVGGFLYRYHPNRSTGINSNGDLEIHVKNYNLAIVDFARPVLTRGFPVERTPHPVTPNLVTVLTVLQ